MQQIHFFYEIYSIQFTEIGTKYLSVLVKILSYILVVERVAKSRVSNSSDSKKSGWEEFQKVGFGYPKSQVFCRALCTFSSKFYGFFIRSGSGRVGYIPDLE